MDEKDKGEREAQRVEELSAHGVPAQLGSDIKDHKKGGEDDKCKNNDGWRENST